MCLRKLWATSPFISSSFIDGDPQNVEPHRMMSCLQREEPGRF